MLRIALAALITTVPAAGPAFAQPPAVAARQAEVRLDHISIVKTGSGPGIVLIPGLGSPREAWARFVPDLAKTRTVHLVQVNGFGGDAPGENLKPGVLDGIVADLHRYLRDEKAAPVRLVGHSMGGLASLLFAREHPDQVERAMIVDALPWFPVLLARGGVDPTPEQVRKIAGMMRDAVAARYGKPVDGKTVSADVDSLALKPESRIQMAKWAAKADPRVTAQLLFEDMSTDVRPALPAMTTPITVVVPWSATSFGKERTMAFYSKQYSGAPNIRFVEVPDSGHFVMLDQPDLFATALQEFAR